MTRVATTEFREKLAYFLDLAARGEPIVIERHGKPSVQLVAVVSDSSQAALALQKWRDRAVLYDIVSPAAAAEDWEMTA